MTLLIFRQNLYQSLESHYPKTEIDSFFKIILEDVLNLSKIDFALNPNNTIPAHQHKIIEDIIGGLVKQEPIQYLIGFTEFMGLSFQVNPNVLIPRPETEALIDWIGTDFQFQNKLEILDIGTGSGCIPICLAKNIKNATVSSIDVSSKAIEVAKLNAIHNGVDVNFINQDILATQSLHQQFDVIVSNPPYVRNLEKEEMQKNVLDYEPHLALFVEDHDPLIFYQKIAELAKNHLKPKGALYFEINQYLGTETVELVKNIGFKTVELKQDMFGKDRMIKAGL